MGVFTRGVVDLIDLTELEARQASGVSLRIKQGFDPSSANLHLGHAVGLRKLRALQEMGHTVVVIIGDYTAQIGDPSGRSGTRPRLAPQQVAANAENWLAQFHRIVDPARTEVRRQSEWYTRMGVGSVMDLLGRFTLAQMLSHETFRQRHAQGQPLSLLEMAYPLLQAYDSVAVESDLELGGTDQRFNMLTGRDLMRQLGKRPQLVATLPLIPGTDGRKMSKSLGNAIELDAAADQMFGRLMAMPDQAVPLLWETLTDLPNPKAGEHPRMVKAQLAQEVVSQLHGPRGAASAAREFDRVTRDGLPPGDVPVYRVRAPTLLLDVLVAVGLATSRSEARRLVAGGGVYLWDRPEAGQQVRISDPELVLKPADGRLLQVGRRRYVRLG